MSANVHGSTPAGKTLTYVQANCLQIKCLFLVDLYNGDLKDGQETEYSDEFKEQVYMSNTYSSQLMKKIQHQTTLITEQQ